MSVLYKKVKQLSAEDAAYLGGLIDGEGTVTLTRRHSYSNRCLAVTISNTDKDLLDTMHTLIGVGKITSKKTYSEKHSIGFTYQVFNRQALDVLQQIFSYLKTYKRERAQIVIEKYLELTPRNGKYTVRMKMKRDIFIKDFFAIQPRNTKAAK